MRARSLLGVVFATAWLIGCSDGDDDAAAQAAARNTIMHYEPPTITSRADYGGSVERRFHRLDRDRDGKLSTAETPRRVQERVAQYDASGDGQLDSGEWGKMMLTRFDEQDVDKDGMVTTEERQAMRAKHDRSDARR